MLIHPVLAVVGLVCIIIVAIELLLIVGFTLYFVDAERQMRKAEEATQPTRLDDYRPGAWRDGSGR